MVFREYLKCDKEGCDAVMSNGKESGLGSVSRPGQPMFVHTCPKCDSLQTLPYHYPRIVYKELPTIFTQEDAIDEVLGKLNVSMDKMEESNEENSDI